MPDICLTCGATGGVFSVALIDCDRCRKYAVHRYCLPVLPPTFHEYVVWYCEDCEQEIDQEKADSSPQNSEPKKADTETLKTFRNGVKNNKRTPKKKKAKKNDAGNQIAVLEKPPSPIRVVNAAEAAICAAPSQPIKDPIWEGSLGIFNKNPNANFGIVAHLSSIAHPRVSEEARQLPRLLSSQLLPRPVVWPRKFSETGTDPESIALYVFPRSVEDEARFDGLLEEMIREDLALRVVAENAELLIFSSMVLPMEYWRFRAKYYLWGVFKGKKQLAQVVVEDDDVVKALTWDAQQESCLSSN